MSARLAVAIACAAAASAGCVSTTHEVHSQVALSRIIEGPPLAVPPSLRARARRTEGGFTIAIERLATCASFEDRLVHRTDLERTSPRTTTTVVSALLAGAGVTAVVAGSSEEHGNADITLGATMIGAGALIYGVAWLQSGTTERPLPTDTERVAREPVPCRPEPAAGAHVYVRCGADGVETTIDANGEVTCRGDGSVLVVAVDGEVVRDVAVER